SFHRTWIVAPGIRESTSNGPLKSIWSMRGKMMMPMFMPDSPSFAWGTGVSSARRPLRPSTPPATRLCCMNPLRVAMTPSPVIRVLARRLLPGELRHPLAPGGVVGQRVQALAPRLLLLGARDPPVDRLPVGRGLLLVEHPRRLVLPQKAEVRLGHLDVALLV